MTIIILNVELDQWLMPQVTAFFKPDTEYTQHSPASGGVSKEHATRNRDAFAHEVSAEV
jgi:hypothetical protein